MFWFLSSHQAYYVPVTTRTDYCRDFCNDFIKIVSESSTILVIFRGVCRPPPARSPSKYGNVGNYK